MKYDVRDVNLAKEGKQKILWAEREMQVLQQIKIRFEKEEPLKNIKIAACLHITSETASLAKTLKAGGADISLCASNPLSTQDEVAASLVKDEKISVFAICGEDNKTYYKHIHSAILNKPNVTLDDGADLVSTLHNERQDLVKNVLGGTEETTTGVIRLRSMEKNHLLPYPIIAVNDAYTKYLFDNRYGTGQSTIDGILRATNILLAGKKFVVCGYGWCGKGVAMRAKGMGAQVIICETSPLKALEAVMDGYNVMPMKEAAKMGNIFVTLTGNTSIIRKEHFILMKDGAIVANSGHFNVEIDIPALTDLSKNKKKIRENVEEFTLSTEKKIYLLGEGRLINLAAAEGHPAQVMDMSFANQALCVEYIVKNYKNLQKKVYSVPQDIDDKIAELKLKSLGIKIDNLTKEQKEYLLSWDKGT